MTTPMPWSMKTRRPMRGARMDLDAGQEAREVRDPARHPVEAVPPPPGRLPVQHHRMQARIAGQHLPAPSAPPGRARGCRRCLRAGARTWIAGCESERASLAAALVDCSRDAAQDVDLFGAQLGAVGQAVQARHQLLRRGRVEKADRLQRLAASARPGRAPRPRRRARASSARRAAREAAAAPGASRRRSAAPPGPG